MERVSGGVFDLQVWKEEILLVAGCMILCTNLFGGRNSTITL